MTLVLDLMTGKSGQLSRKVTKLRLYIRTGPSWKLYKTGINEGLKGVKVNIKLIKF